MITMFKNLSKKKLCLRILPNAVKKKKNSTQYRPNLIYFKIQTSEDL